MKRAILALNAGSSSFKLSLLQLGEGAEEELLAETLPLRDSAAALSSALERARQRLGSLPSVIGHRLVHGGSRFEGPVVVDSAVLAALDGLVPLAPLHLPPALALLRLALERCPDALHVACFDTAFHRSLPDVAKHFALPAELRMRGIVRYGFHGLSYSYVLSALGKPVPRRLVVLHLGSGASAAAIADGRSIDTSMGYTPAGGFPMGTRPGDLDPGIMLQLAREGYGPERLEQLIYRESGLLGLTGTSDMREILERVEQGDATARQGLEHFCYALKKQIGAYAAALGGLDCLVFTGGIGEHAAAVRKLCCQGLGYLGIELDSELNAKNARDIATSSSRVRVLVIETDEDRVIARSAFELAERLTA
jgi:acetate kinase